MSECICCRSEDACLRTLYEVLSESELELLLHKLRRRNTRIRCEELIRFSSFVEKDLALYVDGFDSFDGTKSFVFLR